MYQEERHFMKSLKHSWLALLLVMSFVLAACGADATAIPPTTAPAAANTPTAAAMAADTPTAAMAADTPTTAPAAVAYTTPTVAPTETPVVLGNANAATTITIWHGWGGDYFKTIQGIFAEY